MAAGVLREPAPGVLILADGVAPTRAALDSAWPDWAAGIATVVAADGGARHAAPLGVRVDRWVGDADSIDPDDLAALAEAGVAIDRADPEKDASDTELAILSALPDGAGRVVILGGLGGLRIDHAIANLGLLGHAELAAREVWMFDDRGSRVSLLVAPDATGSVASRDLEGHVGDLVTLVPQGSDARGVTTDGLRYPLAGETLHLGRTRGVSNVRTATRARISLDSGRLLVIETPATVRP